MTSLLDGLRPLDRSRPEPLWSQLADALRQPISAGEWRVGMQIPTEGELEEALGVSRIVVRQGVRQLESEGLLRRDQGRGTFVRDARLVMGSSGLTSFSQDVLRLGARGTSRVLSAEVVPADAKTADALDIREGDDVTRIRRLRLADGAPMGLQVAHVRLDRAPDLHLDDGEHASLYEQLRLIHGIIPAEAEEVYRVGSASAEDAAVLEIPPLTPVFIVERRTRDRINPFEFTVSVMRGDHYEIRAILHTF
jgi:GntR family transcriptional regulator